MKKASKHESIIILMILLFIIVSEVISRVIPKLCAKTNSPFFIFLDIQLDLYAFIILFLVFFILCFSIKSIKTLPADLKELLRHSLSKKKFIILLIIVSLPHFFFMPHKFGNTKVNGEKALKPQYSFYLLCDAVKGETESLVVNSRELDIDYYSYTSGGGRHFRTHAVYYASYKGYSFYLYNTDLNDYIKKCQKSKRDIELEYYKNSGIIKTIDGIELYDSSGFINAIYKIEKDK